MQRKIPTNFSFEIINIAPVNPYISECQIKVFYTGKNRNGSYISKPVGEKIAQTLPRSPIVAYYNEEIETRNVELELFENAAIITIKSE